jgi:hypothetical protein
MSELAISQDLLKAIGKQCDCQFTETGELISVCASHQALAEEDESYVRHMEFARSLRARLVREENRGYRRR